MFSCFRQAERSDTLSFQTSVSVTGKTKYDSILQLVHDTIRSWSDNKLGYYSYCGVNKNCIIDPLICFNTDGSRFIGALLQQQLSREAVSDDIDYFLGEKINNSWYFFSTDNLMVPRSIKKNHPLNKPLPYGYLHKTAWENLFIGYLKKNGEINEEWFTHHFEGPGWGDFNDQASQDWFLKGKRFTSRREFFEFAHLDKVRNNWYGIKKDSVLTP
jgi:hypothetical protein